MYLESGRRWWQICFQKWSYDGNGIHEDLGKGHVRAGVINPSGRKIMEHLFEYCVMSELD